MRHRIYPVTATCENCGATWADTAHSELGIVTLAEEEWCPKCGSYEITTEEVDPADDW